MLGCVSEPSEEKPRRTFRVCARRSPLLCMKHCSNTGVRRIVAHSQPIDSTEPGISAIRGTAARAEKSGALRHELRVNTTAPGHNKRPRASLPKSRQKRPSYRNCHLRARSMECLLRTEQKPHPLCGVVRDVVVSLERVEIRVVQHRVRVIGNHHLEPDHGQDEPEPDRC